jgi:peptide/nickel transport system ATP-binding protein/oligopeptide transport system ATP-binding protein
VPDPGLARSQQRQVLGGDVPSPSNPPSACRFHTRCPKFVAGHCDVEEPLLEEKAPGDLAACHYPLSDQDLARAVPLAAR